jgi:hypothetical protein
MGRVIRDQEKQITLPGSGSRRGFRKAPDLGSGSATQSVRYIKLGRQRKEEKKSVRHIYVRSMV